MSFSNIAELAVPYAILALHDDNVEVNAENINKILEASNIKVEPVWINVFINALKGKKISEMLTSFSSSSASCGAPAAAASESSAPAAASGDSKKKEAPKKVEKEESDEEMGMGLFD